MRKVILDSSVSLDGYLARADGGLEFLKIPKGYTMSALFDGVDTLAFGRKTFDEALKRMGGTYNPPPPRLPTYIFSKSRSLAPGDGVIFTRDTPSDFIATRRKEVGKNILVMGGGELARSFLTDDAVDEISLRIHPILLGSGIPFFPPGFPERAFRLADSKNYEPDGILMLRYVRR
jgi:dihydrofolate reductase